MGMWTYPRAMDTTPAGSAAPATPAHLLPESCYVCGGADHGNTYDRTGKGHNFWANAAAAAYFHLEDQRPLRVVYSSGEDTAEGHYVATTRGR